jgi:hypothetical protein
MEGERRDGGEFVLLAGNRFFYNRRRERFANRLLSAAKELLGFGAVLVLDGEDGPQALGGFL